MSFSQSTDLQHPNLFRMNIYSDILPKTERELPISTVHLRADVVFGSPKRNCAGNGICRMLAVTSLRPLTATPCPYFRTTLRAIAADRLLLELSADQLPQSQFERLFGDQLFRVEATFRLPLSITRPLFGHRVAIPAGYHPYTVRDGRIFIHFQVTASRKLPVTGIA